MTRRRFLPLLIAAAFWSAPAYAQRQRGDEVLTDAPSYRGTEADSPIPTDLHLKIEGGSDGSGLCVIASLVINGQYQKVPATVGGKASTLWVSAKARPGGYYPEKLAALLNEVAPDERWVSYTGTDSSVVEKLSRAGYAVGVTMNTGELYGGQPIHHMVSLLHYREDGMACIVDNNEPGVYLWITAEEFRLRWIDGGEGWAVSWLRTPAGEAVAWSLVALAMLAGMAVYLIEVSDG